MFRESKIFLQLHEKVDEHGQPVLPLWGCPQSAVQTAQEEAFDQVMSTLRQSIEWDFGDITRTFAFPDFQKNLKLYFQPVGALVGALYKPATILTNCRACLYGSQTSQYFAVQPPSLPPSLQDYLLFGNHR